MGEPCRWAPRRIRTMNRTASLAARLRDLQARSDASDQAAAAALDELKTAGHQLADTMAALADALREAAQ